MELEYRMNHEQFCDARILRCKVEAAGSLLNYWRPGEFPSSPQFLMDLGLGLVQTAAEIEKLLQSIEEDAIKGNKKTG